MSATDHELMRRLAAGDHEALDTLVARWQAGVTRLLRRLVSEPADVQDLLQETFVRVLTGARRYRPEGAFSTWLYRIAINLARDSARRSTRRPLPLEIEPHADGNGAPPRQCARRELAGKVERALAALPPELREVLVLKHYAELSFTEAADVLSLPVSTVKSRCAVALKKLKARLQQDGIDESELEP